MGNTARCIERLQAVADEELARGVPTTLIIAAIAEVAVRVANTEPETKRANLESLAAVIKTVP